MSLNEHFRILFDCIGDPAFLADSQTGVLVDCNVAAERLFGWSRDQMIGQHQSFLHPPESEEESREGFRRSVAAGCATAIQGQILTSSGERRQVMINTSLLRIGERMLNLGVFRDITDETRAREALQREAAYRNQLMESAADGICVCHAIDEFPYVRFTLWNRSMVELTGYDIEEINRKGWYQSMYRDPAQQERARARMERMRQNEPLRQEEWEITTRDGQPRTVSITTTNVLDEAGRPSVLAVMRDVTLQRQREHEVRDQAAFLQRLINGIDAPIFYKDEDGYYLGCNRGFADFLGRPAEEIVGRHTRDLSPLENANRYLSMDRSLLRSGGVQEYEHTVRMRDGTDRHVLFQKSVLPEPVNGKRVLVGVLLDITERRRVEEALRSSERFLSEVQRVAGVIGWRVDPRTRALEWIGDVHRMLDLPEHLHLTLETAIDLAHEEYRGVVRHRMDRLLEYGEPFDHEARFRTETGREGWVRLVGQAELQEGRVVRAFGTMQDVTEWKRVQEALADAQRMAAVGLLAAGIAHEFNNAMTGVVGYLSLLEETPGLSNEIRERVGSLRRNSLRVTGLTRSLLALSSEGASGAEADLSEIVREAVNVAAVEARLEAVELRLDLEEGLRFPGRSGEIGQVALNLLINAAHALLGREERRIEVRTGRRGDRVFLQVKDTGVGIPPEELDQVFLPFFSRKGEKASAGSPLAAVRGTGLGLSLCRHIVNKHGGEVRVDSQVGRGSEFLVLLPSRVEPEAGDSATARAGLGDGGASSADGAATEHLAVLVLDDDADVREYLQTALGPLVRRVAVAESGREALDLLREEAFGLVLFDLLMPGMPGQEFARRARELAGENPMLVAMTGWAGGAELNPGAEADGLLHKPLAFETLRNLLQTAAQRGER